MPSATITIEADSPTLAPAPIQPPSIGQVVTSPTKLPSEPAAPWRIPSLDGLRGLAILAVIYSKVVHSPGFILPGEHLYAGKLGSIGVDLFFVISGFLITTLLLREQSRTGSISLRGFYFRRALRIIPAYATLLLALANLQFARVLTFDWFDWLTAMTWTVNLPSAPWVAKWDMGHVWSLSVEEHFYLIWPFLFTRLTRRQAVLGIMASVVGVFGLRWAYLILWPASAENVLFWTWTRFDAIALGCGLAYAATDPAWSEKLDEWSYQTWYWPGILLGTIFTVVLMLASTKLGIGLGCTLSAVLMAATVWGAVRHPRTRFGKFLNRPFLAWIGVLSYSLYLWHRLVLRHEDLGWMTCPWNLVELAVLAIACHYLIERPFLSLKDQWGSTRAQAPARD